MKPGKASRTAMHMALFRALESTRAAKKRLFFDPLAKFYLNVPFRLVAALSHVPLARAAICRYIDYRWPGARTSGIARTRAIDDALHAALAEGARQVVILGAGYDARAYRIPGMRKVAVFEVDHPATSAQKQQRTRQVLGTLPACIRFVQIDFDRQSLETVLQDAGYDPRLNSVFIWEGVSNYLTAEAVDATLAFCARAAAGSRVVFTYMDRRALEAPQKFTGAEHISRFLKNLGEGWKSGIDPRQLSIYLRSLGLGLESDLAADQYRQKYYASGCARMQGYEWYHVAVAMVPGGFGEPKVVPNTATPDRCSE